MKKFSLVILSFLFCFCLNAQSHRKYSKDLECYKWYGKRFDWILDLYGHHPAHPDSVQLFISEIGEGKDTFLVLHGGFGAEHSYMLEGLLPVADKAHLIFYDQRGSLRSPCPDSLISLEHHINDIERIRNAFQLKRINLIGHSMGTFLALSYLQKFPDNTGKLILISSLPISQKDSIESEQVVKYQNAFFEKLGNEQSKRWKKELIAHHIDTAKFSKYGYRGINASTKMHLNTFWSASGQIVNYDNWELTTTGSSFLYKTNAAEAVNDFPQFWDFTAAVTSHKFPVIFIKASGDYLSPQLLLKQVRGISNVTFIEIKNAGHNMWIEAPEAFKKALQDAILK